MINSTAIYDYYDAGCPEFLGEEFNKIAEKNDLDPDQLIAEIEASDKLFETEYL